MMLYHIGPRMPEPKPNDKFRAGHVDSFGLIREMNHSAVLTDSHYGLFLATDVGQTFCEHSIKGNAYAFNIDPSIIRQAQSQKYDGVHEYYFDGDLWWQGVHSGKITFKYKMDAKDVEIEGRRYAANKKRIDQSRSGSEEDKELKYIFESSGVPGLISRFRFRYQNMSLREAVALAKSYAAQYSKKFGPPTIESLENELLTDKRPW